MTKHRHNPKSPTFLPTYLESYATEVDDWYREALARRAARAAHPAGGGG